MDLSHITHCRHFEDHQHELPLIVQQKTGALTKRLFIRLVAFSRPGDGAIILYILTHVSLYAMEWLPKQHLFDCVRQDTHTKITLKLCTGNVQMNHWDPMAFDFTLEEFICLFHVIDEYFPNLFRIDYTNDKDGTITGMSMVRNTEFNHLARMQPPKATAQGEAERFLAALIHASQDPREPRDASYVRSTLRSGERTERRTTIPAKGSEEDPNAGNQAANGA